jgi:hypothetical protein
MRWMILSIAFLSSIALGSTLRAKISDLEVPNGPVLYFYEASQSSESDSSPKQHFQTTYKNLAGELFATEKGSVEGAEFISYELAFPLFGESGKIERKDGKILMSYRTPKGEKTARLNWKPNYVIGPTIPEYVRAHWDEIMAGKSVDVKMIVAERLEGFSFRLVKGADVKFNGQDRIKVLFKPSNRVVRMVVEPVELTFDRQTRRTLRIAGRSLVRKKIGDKWADLRGDMIFDYE